MLSDVLIKINEADKSEVMGLLSTYVKCEFKKSLYIPESESIEVDISIFDLGLNSLGAETLKQKFEEDLGCRIDTTDFFSNPTVSHFVNNLYSLFVADEPESNVASSENGELREMVGSMFSAMYGLGTKD